VRRVLRVSLILVMLASLMLPASAAAARSAAADSPRGAMRGGLAARLAQMRPDQRTRVILTMRDPSLGRLVAVASGDVRAMRTRSRIAQRGVRGYLRGALRDGAAGRVTPLWITDAVSVSATPAVIRSLAARPDVATIRPDAVTVVPAATTPEVNIATVGAPALWRRGILGQGVVVASLDSGVDMTHPDLKGSYRGGTDSWYDPYGQHPATPVDMTGHGTGTMGVIVGADMGGTSVGVAPGARWIAARIWNDAGTSSMTAIHQTFQWLLDPDGNASTDDAPDVVNLSWSLGSAPGCDLSLQPDLQALRSAGILPVVAAGNFGPALGSSVSPANYPEALAVGAVNASEAVWSGSGRGATTCGGSTGVYPELVAPGTGIRTTDRYGFYQSVTGTSVAAPHVTGAVALLLSSHPGANPDQLWDALTGSAKDLGTVGPDDIYGFGRLDIDAADAAMGPSQLLDLSISANGARSLGSLSVADEDIVRFNGAAFSMVFDGSDVGVTGDVDAFARLDADSFLISLAAPATLPGVGAVDDSDVVRFDATSNGSFTAGTFSMYLHGSDVGLSTDAEDVDAVEALPDGRVLLSIRGKGTVPGVATVQDEDLVAFTPTSLGATSSGTFAVYFDGSDVGLVGAASEDVDAASVASDGRILLSTLGAFAVPGVSGADEDLFACAPTSLGATTACAYSTSLSLDGSAWGLGGLGVDAADLT
jgi:subtilisin family serine protease